MKAAEIRKLASDPTRGVPHDEVYGPSWMKHHPRTRDAIIGMGLMAPPYGSPKHGEPVLFLPGVAMRMHPPSKGSALAARIEDERGGFLRTWGNVAARWQWFPDIYQDENGVPNCLVVMADGFPMIRVRLGVDEQWRLDYIQRDEISRRRFGDKYEGLPSSWKVDVAFPEYMVRTFLTALGKPLDTDPVSLMGTVVSEDQILAMIRPRL